MSVISAILGTIGNGLLGIGEQSQNFCILPFWHDEPKMETAMELERKQHQQCFEQHRKSNL